MTTFLRFATIFGPQPNPTLADACEVCHDFGAFELLQTQKARGTVARARFQTQTTHNTAARSHFSDEQVARVL